MFLLKICTIHKQKFYYIEAEGSNLINVNLIVINVSLRTFATENTLVRKIK